MAADLQQLLGSLASGELHWPGGANLVGTLIDRQVLRVPGVGDFQDDALLVFLQAIRSASESSWIFERMWKTIRDDRTVDMWWYDAVNPSRSVSFEFQFHRLFPIEDLYMVVSTFVPFGAPGDKSHYRPERSDDFQRSTQTLRAILSVQGRRVMRSSHQGTHSTDSLRTTSKSQDVSRRLSSGRTASHSNRRSENNGNSREENERCSLLWPGQSGARGEYQSMVRQSSSSDCSSESRSESTFSDTSEHGQSSREHDESSYRGSTVDGTEEIVEITGDLRFSAIGPDFSQPDQTYAAWKANPANEATSLSIDMLNIAVPTLGPIIERGVAHRRMERRARRESFQPRFWDEAKQLIAFHNPTAYGRRIVMEHDGALNPIQPAAMLAAYEEARYSLGELLSRSNLLPPGR